MGAAVAIRLPPLRLRYAKTQLTIDGSQEIVGRSIPAGARLVDDLPSLNLVVIVGTTVCRSWSEVARALLSRGIDVRSLTKNQSRTLARWQRRLAVEWGDLSVDTVTAKH